MTQPYHAPPRAGFLQKLGPGGAASLGLALLGGLAFLGLPVAFRARQVLRGAAGQDPQGQEAAGQHTRDGQGVWFARRQGGG